jgi:chromosome segregation ATPase
VLSKIILPAKNFIMLQGDTDSLATIDPKKLTELFEYTSGSVQYKNICLSIQDELSKIVTRLRELQFQKAGMRNE